MNDDRRFMDIALDEARRAFAEEEVPVGAAVVFEGRVVSRGRNAKESSGDPTAHAEMLAIRRAAQALGRWRLSGCTLYVTLEPCPMCIGAMLSARMDRLVFGCTDEKAGAAVTLYDLARDSRMNHRLEVASGVMADEAARLLKDFFRQRRGNA
jgi:tRNA(adenine34) deaminase